MFKAPFSFDGRIRRSEYGLSLIIYSIIAVIMNTIVAASLGEASILFIAYIPLLWFLWAQGAKRCHDLGNSGWWQLIPFYSLWLIFQDGKPGLNEYGENPKGVQVFGGQIYQGGQNTGSAGGYNGGYNGGHNNPGNYYSQPDEKTTNDEYKDGDLYK